MDAVDTSLDLLIDGTDIMLSKSADSSIDLMLSSANDGTLTKTKLYAPRFNTLTKGDPVDVGSIDSSSANANIGAASPTSGSYASM